MQKEVDIWTKYTKDGKGWNFIPTLLEVIKTPEQWHCQLIAALMYFAHCLSPVALQLKTSGENKNKLGKCKEGRESKPSLKVDYAPDPPGNN